MHDVLAFAAQCKNEGKKAALVTVTETEGSSPASAGQMIAVLADGTTVGTVGGGASEHLVINKAVEAVKNGEKTFSMVIDHTENDMICGGKMKVFGNIIGNNSELCIFGGGHIGQSLAGIAAQAGFYVSVIEDRPEFKKYFEPVNYKVYQPDEYEITDPAGNADFVVICTRGHKTDAEALRYCLTKEFKYIGMIGCKNKVTELFSELRAEGVKQTELDKIYAPVGLDIANAIPAEIAIAILAEILLIKNEGELRHKKLENSLQA